MATCLKFYLDTIILYKVICSLMHQVSSNTTRIPLFWVKISKLNYIWYFPKHFKLCVYEVSFENIENRGNIPVKREIWPLSCLRLISSGRNLAFCFFMVRWGMITYILTAFPFKNEKFLELILYSEKRTERIKIKP